MKKKRKARKWDEEAESESNDSSDYSRNINSSSDSDEAERPVKNEQGPLRLRKKEPRCLRLKEVGTGNNR